MKIVLTGGFHDSPDLIMRVKGHDFHPSTHSLWEILSESQQKKASKHFCGIEGCTCGSTDRVSWYELITIQ